MTRPLVRIHDTSTDEVIDREMNDSEFAQYETDQATQATQAEAQAQADAAKAALLAKLGITADELKTLLS